MEYTPASQNQSRQSGQKNRLSERKPNAGPKKCLFGYRKFKFSDPRHFSDGPNL